MHKTHFFFLSVFLLTASCDIIKKSETLKDEGKFSNPLYRIMFWNIENLFDIFNDSLTNDDEFTPESIRRWTYTRYKQKINNIYKVFTAAGNPYPPEIIALCEIENRQVLLDLTFTSPFIRYEYKIIHRDSKDRRGIDVGVLFNPRLVKVLNIDFITPVTGSSGKGVTRDIVYLEAFIAGRDTVHLFFNHWPSKYGGAGLTEPLRRQVAATLRNYIDSIQNVHFNAKIIIGGDFNDPPEGAGLREVLGSVCAGEDTPEQQKLYNLSCSSLPGTHKHQGIWATIDQFIVTGNMFGSEAGRRSGKLVFEIFVRDFLLEKDEAFSGEKPFRTWVGMRYKGGYSDHLPVILNVY